MPRIPLPLPRPRHLATLTALVALFTLSGGAALADGGKSVAVKPLAPRAGEVITVKGAGLGANRQVELRLIGQGTNIDLGEVQSVDDGDFDGEFRLPADLKAGTYELRAVGDGTESAQLTIAAAGSGATPAASMENEAIAQRPLGEVALLVALFGGLAGLGLFFARTAHEQPRPARASTAAG